MTIHDIPEHVDLGTDDRGYRTSIVAATPGFSNPNKRNAYLSVAVQRAHEIYEGIMQDLGQTSHLFPRDTFWHPDGHHVAEATYEGAGVFSVTNVFLGMGDNRDREVDLRMHIPVEHLKRRLKPKLG